MSKINSRNLLMLFEGSQLEFEQIQALYESGQLSKLLGVSALDVGAVTESQHAVEPIAPLERDSVVVRLSQWFDNLFDSNWIPVDRIPSPAYRSSGVRPKVIDLAPTTGSVSRAKVIDLGMQVSGQAVALVVRLMSRADGIIDLYLRCYPAGDSIYLPQGLQLLVLDDGATVLESRARNSDICLQLDLEGQPGGQFSVQLKLGDCQITENFLI